MPLTMPSMKAFRTVGDKKAAVVDYELPVPTENQVLVAVKALGLNPTDWKHVAYITPENCGVGCDYAGVIEYDAHGYKKGDRVGGFVHGGAYEKQGAFAEYLVTEPDVLFRIPDHVSFEEAAAFPIPFVTAALALYQKLNLNDPLAGKKSDEFVLIYGGSSAVGVQAIQLAKLSGYRVIATASEKNFELLSKLGAEKCFDYKSSDVVDQIKAYTENKLMLELDTISEEKSLKISTAVLAPKGKLILLLPPPKDLRSDIEVINVLAYTTLGKALNYGPFNVPAQPQDKTFATKTWQQLTDLLTQKKIQPSPIKEISGGLNGIQEGFDYMSSGKVSGEKVVFKL